MALHWGFSKEAPMRSSEWHSVIPRSMEEFAIAVWAAASRRSLWSLSIICPGFDPCCGVPCIARELRVKRRSLTYVNEAGSGFTLCTANTPPRLDRAMSTCCATVGT